jgi:hypothetical protein
MSVSLNIKEVKNPLSSKNIELISELVSQTRFGSVTIVIQDGVIVQIDKNEKIRVK